MKRIYLLLVFWTAILCSAHRLGAQCTTDAGTLQPGSAELCEGGQFQLPYLNDATLDGNDILAFVLHTGSPTQIGTVLWWSSSPVLFIPPGIVAPGTYQVAAVAGNNAGNGQVDLNDPCFSLSGGFALTIKPQPAVFLSASNDLSCATPQAEIQSMIVPPGNYLYFWGGPGNFTSNAPNPIVSEPGAYWVSVTEPGSNCGGFGTITILQTDTFDVEIGPVGFDCNAGGLPGTLGATVSGATGPVSYLWSNGATTPTIAIATPGSYCVTVTQTGNGCTRVDCFQAFSNPPLTAEIQYNPLFGCFDSTYLYVAVNGGGITYSVEWNTGEQSNLIENPLPGFYSVTVTNPLGCSVVASYFLENGAGEECGLVLGTVFADYNNNCIFDAGDVGLNQQIIEFTGINGTDYSYTWNGGAYQIRLPMGNYEVNVSSASALWQACQPSYTITVGFDDTTTLNLPLQPVELCPALSVELHTNFLRRCFNNTFHVQYCNLGSADATNAYVDVTLDPFLIFQSAQVTSTSLGNNVYRFDLGTVGVGDCGTFWIAVLVDCDATLGQTHCTTAEIFPHDPCPSASALWSGASIELMAECAGDSLNFYAVNSGLAPTTVPLDYVVIEDAIMRMNSSLPANLPIGSPVKIAVPANGSTWRVESQQEPFHPGVSMPSLSIEGCSTNGLFSLGFLAQFAQNDQDPWIDEDCLANVGAYDPNDKQGFPAGYSASHYVRPETELEYAIRFQNTGTDTAFTVVVRDSLSPWLDRATIVPGPSSHPYRFDFYGDGLLKFTFENIALPDSNVDLAGSQGFVSFRVKPRADVPLETDIFNNASIYFDFNEPIVTNTTVHRVGENFVTSATWQPLRPGIELRIAPHPVTDRATIELTGLAGLSDWQLTLTDALGRTLRTADVSGPRWTLERNGLPAGVYTVVVRQRGQALGTAKLILR